MVNHMKNKKLFIILLVGCLFAGLSTSCYIPNPLYGTWGDNQGNKITFQSTGDFTSSIINTAGDVTEYSGTWTCINNTLVIVKTSEDKESRFVVEWDVRGAMLYLTWVDNFNTNQKLTLAHLSK